MESLAPLIKTTLLASLVGALLAWLIHYLLKVLPFATLRRAMDGLADSKRQLQSEVAAKEQALAKITELYEGTSEMQRWTIARQVLGVK